MTRKERLKQVPWVYETYLLLKNFADKVRWNLSGRPVPTPHVMKKEVVLGYGRRYGLSTLIETGTHYGLMLWAARKVFREIHTVELDDSLHARARQVFGRFGNIHLWHGDSGTVMKDLVTRVTEPCLFWLDAHYSGPGTARSAIDTPIVAELATIFTRSTPDVILIDDARLFVGADGYPRLDELREYVRKHRPHATVAVENDVIRITP